MKNLTLIITLVLLLFPTGADARGLGKKQVKIKITSQNIQIEAILNNTAPSQNLIKRLPITLNLHQHQSREYYTDIILDKNANTQDSYQIGDIAYWKPGNSLVFFYDRGYTKNLIIMGKITSGLEKLPNMKKSFQARIEKIED